MSQTISPAITEALLFQGIMPKRICAFLLDVIFMGVFGWLLAGSIFLFGIFTLGLGFLLFHIVPFVPILYYTAMVAGGGTFGQRILGLSVRQDADLSAPTPAQAFVWSILLWLSLVVFAGLPLLMAMVGSRHRAFHDIFSGLAVLRTPKIFY